MENLKLGFLSLLFFFSSLSGQLNFSGYYQSWTAVRSQKEYDFMLLRNRLRLNTLFDQGMVTGHLSLDIRNDKEDPGSELEILLREAYVNIYFEKVDFRIGKQQVVWGKADGLFINDIVCPLDMRMFLLQEFDNIRMGLPMFKANVYFDNWALEGVWIPEFEPWKFASAGSDWEFQLGPPDTLPTVIVSPPESYIVPNIIHMGAPSLPDASLNNSEYGFKFSSFFFGTDISVLFLNGFHDQPAAQLDSMNMTQVLTSVEKIDSYLTPYYYRSNMYGFNFSRSLFSMVVRGEMGYFLNRRFPDFGAELLTSESDFFQGMIGLDVSGPYNIGISFQGIQQQIIEHTDSMADKKIYHMASILVRGAFLRETAYITALGILDLNDVEWQVRDFSKSAGLSRFIFDYSWMDGLTLSFGADIMWGKQNSIFGQFKNNDNLFFKVKYSF